jgi:competence protein ComEC
VPSTRPKAFPHGTGTALYERIKQAISAESLQAFIGAQKDNAILWLPVLLGLGIGLYFSLKFEPSPWIGVVSLVFCACGALFSAFTLQRTTATLIFSAAVLVSLGHCAAQFRTYVMDAPALSRSMSPARIEGTIRAIDDLDGNRGVRVILENLDIQRLTPEQTPKTIRISIRQEEGLLPGQRINVLAGLNPPAAPISPGGFDFQRHAYFKGIGAYGFAYGAPEILENTTSGRLERFRQREARHVETVVPHPEASIVSALLLGERAAIPEDTWEDIRAAGLAHVISISGLHISMIAFGVFFVARLIMALIPRLALYHPIKKYAAFLGIITCVAYGIMVGLEVPTLRSMMMTGVVMAAIMIDRNPFSLRLIAFSAFFILLTQPETLTNPGFQMSYAAVAALIFFYEETQKFWSSLHKRMENPWKRRIVIALLGTCVTSVVATLATTPFTLYHFQQFPIYSVVGNVVALPVIGLIIMPAAVITYILMPIGLDGYAIWVMGQGVRAMLWISHEIASWHYASLDLVTWPRSALLCLVASGLWIALFKGTLRWGALPLFCAGIVFIMMYKPPDILVSSNAKVILIQPDKTTGWLSTRRSDKFTSENWIRAGGIDPQNVDIWPKEGTLKNEDGNTLSCDNGGCIATIKGKSIAFAFDPYSAVESCAYVDLVIAQEPVKRHNCPDTRIIDRWELRRKGAHAIWIDKHRDTLKIETVLEQRGDRPWTAAGSNRR